MALCSAFPSPFRPPPSASLYSQALPIGGPLPVEAQPAGDLGPSGPPPSATPPRASFRPAPRRGPRRPGPPDTRRGQATARQTDSRSAATSSRSARRIGPRPPARWPAPSTAAAISGDCGGTAWSPGWPHRPAGSISARRASGAIARPPRDASRRRRRRPSGRPRPRAARADRPLRPRAPRSWCPRCRPAASRAVPRVRRGCPVRLGPASASPPPAACDFPAAVGQLSARPQ